MSGPVHRALCIHETDNAAVVLSEVASGDEVIIQGGEKPGHLVACEEIPAGHKMALTSLKEGQFVIKYGEPIGKATRSIQIGEHIHTHNLVGLRGRMRFQDGV